MKANQKGFSIVEVSIIIVVVGLIGAVSWLVYDRQKSKTASVKQTSTQEIKQPTTKDPNPSIQNADYKTLDGIKYIVPESWKAAKGPYQASELTENGRYLLSPDYKEAGGGILSIEAGAYISFKKLEWAGIDSNTTPDQAVTVIMNGQGGYLDPNSIELTAVGGKQVVMFDTGHTTDGVSAFYKASSGQWLDTSFTTTSGRDGKYSAKDSPHYKNFLEWLESFIKLNN